MEKEIATHSSILAWRMPWIEEPGGLTVPGVEKSGTGLGEKKKKKAQDVLLRVLFYCK